MNKFIIIPGFDIMISLILWYAIGFIPMFSLFTLHNIFISSSYIAFSMIFVTFNLFVFGITTSLYILLVIVGTQIASGKYGVIPKVTEFIELIKFNINSGKITTVEHCYLLYGKFNNQILNIINIYNTFMYNYFSGLYEYMHFFDIKIQTTDTITHTDKLEDLIDEPQLEQLNINDLMNNINQVNKMMAEIGKLNTDISKRQKKKSKNKYK